MRVLGAVTGALLACALTVQPAFADKRIALVIGNSAYLHVARLANPSNDASAIAATFRKAHFDSVDSRSDLSAAEMRKVLREFGTKARDADVAVIYYAGHGIEVDGTNYMIPVDAQLENDTDVYDETVPLERVLVTIEPARRLRLVILDACRDNPFAKSMKRTVGSRMIGRGLAKVEPTSPNTMIAFAAKAGFVASDGGSAGNSPFAAALAEHLVRPGLDLRKAFGFVRDDVLKATGNRQEPFIYGSLGGNDVTLVPAASAPAAAADPDAAARRDYELAAQVGTREGWDFFLATYTSGFYANLARAQRNKLLAEEARLAAAEKARLAAEEKARLIADNAKAAELAKAAREARAAEEARVAAEKRKAAEEARLAEAERARAAAQARAEEARTAAERKKAAEDQRAAEAKAGEEKRKQEAAEKMPIGQVAALPQPEQVALSPGPVRDIPKLLQTELRRVGCSTGAIDGEWGAAAEKSLALFNRHAGLKLDVKTASIDALDAVKGKSGRVCPLVCERGFKAEGESCVRVDPAKPSAKREAAPSDAAPSDAKAKRDQAQQQPAKPRTSSGQILCDQGGCRPVRPGCRISSTPAGVGGSVGGPSMAVRQFEVCN